MKHVLILLGLMLAPVAGAAAKQPVLVELFASQNCNACPKAHQTLKAVEAEHLDDVLVLTWSVDYWDYLGAPDPMAIPDATARQAAYTDRFGIRAPYTPQSVYDGAIQCPATRKQAVEANISERAEANGDSKVDIMAVEGGVSLDGYVARPAEIRLVEFLSGKSNSTNMVNPVTSTRLLGTWTGGRVMFGYECRTSCAVIVQQRDHGEVYAASRLP